MDFDKLQCMVKLDLAPKVLQQQLVNFQVMLAQYPPEDRFNINKIGLFYKIAPDKTIAQRQLSGVKKNKSRLTVAFLTNETGTH